ncbi:hypothetical protein AHAS_Ahas12G0120700 [Arachis hypogaea]
MGSTCGFYLGLWAVSGVVLGLGRAGLDIPVTVFGAHRGVKDIVGCTLLLMSWIYQKFSQWCPPKRGIYIYPMVVR